MDSKENLIKLAKKFDYKPEMLEKTYQLLTILKHIMSVPYLKERLVLKGGTALNLFVFNGIPRLSVDIDLNYIGQVDKLSMLEERQIINEAIEKIFWQNKFELYRNSNFHAGGKMIWRYSSVLGQGGNIEIDLNYMYRVPLWPYVHQKPKLDLIGDFKCPILDIHELTAGKLSAFFTRNASRDLFDTHYLFTKSKFDTDKLRLSFVIYMAMTAVDLSRLDEINIQYNLNDIKNKLLPVLRQQKLPRDNVRLKAWADNFLKETKEKLRIILPLKRKEREFIECIRLYGDIRPDLITKEERLQKIVFNHPTIRWSAMKAKTT